MKNYGRTILALAIQHVSRMRRITLYIVYIIRRMRDTCWMAKAKDTHSEYVILTALPCQQWLRERITVLVCVRCLFFFSTVPVITSGESAEGPKPSSDSPLGKSDLLPQFK